MMTQYMISNGVKYMESYYVATDYSVVGFAEHIDDARLFKTRRGADNAAIGCSKSYKNIRVVQIEVKRTINKEFAALNVVKIPEHRDW